MHTIPFTSVYFWKRSCADYFEDILPKEAEEAFKLTASGFVLTPEAASYQDIIYQGSQGQVPRIHSVCFYNNTDAICQHQYAACASAK